jgi:hypothetical protein
LSTKVTKGHEEKTFVPLFVSLVNIFITAKTTPRGRGKGQGIAAARARKFRRRPTQYARRMAIRRLRQNILSSLKFDRRPLTADRRKFLSTVYANARGISQPGANNQPTMCQQFVG